MAELDIHQFACLGDNYGVLVHDREAGTTASIDAPEVAPIVAALDEKGWRLTHILTTHHHHDHVGGIEALKAETHCTVIAPRSDAHVFPGRDVALAEGDDYTLGSHTLKVLETPGHTSDHVTYWLPEAGVAFVGDTLFAMGCGRLFEGDAETMWHSLQKIMALPPETRIYCGHEYTEANARFALSIEPGNMALQARFAEVLALRKKGLATLPTTLALELATNPFLRPESPEIQARLAMEGAPLWEIFAEIRRRKDMA